jgi:hypothetical protein
MANYLAIAAIGRTLLRLIEEQCPREEFTDTPAFKLYQSHDFGTPAIAEGFSLMLYRATVNSVARNQPPRRGRDGIKRRPSLPVDLHFMLTPWALEAERQLRLLGWVMRFAQDNAILPAAVLNQSLTRRERPAFDPDEGVELFADAPVLADYLGLWDKFKSRWQTSLTYGVRTVLIESEIPIREEALVQTRILRHGTEQLEAPG